jgi:hypothetical protein
MRLLLCADLRIGGEEEFFRAVDRFDNTFSSRYFRPLGNLETLCLVSEKHWEADKYHIFYLEVEDEKSEEFVKVCKSQLGESLNVIAPVENTYDISGEPLFKTDKFGWTNIPRNLKYRGERFSPLEPHL